MKIFRTCLCCGKVMNEVILHWFCCNPCGFGIGEGEKGINYYQIGKKGVVAMAGWKEIPEGCLLVVKEEGL